MRDEGTERTDGHLRWDDAAQQAPLGAQVDHAGEKLVILIDFTGWSLSTAPPMKTSRETLSILQDHFPERLAVAVCYNPPWIFAVFWVGWSAHSCIYCIRPDVSLN